MNSLVALALVTDQTVAVCTATLSSLDIEHRSPHPLGPLVLETIWHESAHLTANTGDFNPKDHQPRSFGIAQFQLPALLDVRRFLRQHTLLTSAVNHLLYGPTQVPLTTLCDIPAPIILAQSCRDTLLSITLCALRYIQYGRAHIPTITQRAEHWKSIYNTCRGAGQAAHYVDSAHLLYHSLHIPYSTEPRPLTFAPALIYDPRIVPPETPHV